MATILSNMVPPVLVAGGVAVVATIGLTIAAKVFYVEENPLIDVVEEILPGANCGGCGYPGCREFATAIVTTKDPNLFCPVGGSEVMKKIAEVLGIEVQEKEKLVARVKCRGTCDMVPQRAVYKDVPSCKVAHTFFPSISGCRFGCLGLGDCVKVCPTNAIKIINGVAWVDEEKCISCGQCVKACPRGIIEMVPISQRYWVACANEDKGPETSAVCNVGCIACGLCVKACKEHFNGEMTAVDLLVKEGKFLAKIDSTKCDNCGECAKVCPKSTIIEFTEYGAKLSESALAVK